MVEDFLIADIQTLPSAAAVDPNSGLNQLHEFVVETEVDVVHHAEAVSETKQVK